MLKKNFLNLGKIFVVFLGIILIYGCMAQEKYKVVADYLNVRSGPSKDYSIKFVLEKNNVVFGAGKKERKWVLIWYPDHILRPHGWVHSNYLENIE